MFEKHAAARFGATIAPPVGGVLHQQRTRANGRDLSQLGIAEELVERLHISTEPVIVPHH